MRGSNLKKPNGRIRLWRREVLRVALQQAPIQRRVPQCAPRFPERQVQLPDANAPDRLQWVFHLAGHFALHLWNRCVSLLYLYVNTYITTRHIAQHLHYWNWRAKVRIAIFFNEELELVPDGTFQLSWDPVWPHRMCRNIWCDHMFKHTFTLVITPNLSYQR